MTYSSDDKRIPSYMYRKEPSDIHTLETFRQRPYVNGSRQAVPRPIKAAVDNFLSVDFPPYSC
jgi:hypothetical protein